MDDVPISAGEVVDGTYVVEGELGSGGMGVVVVARHVSTQEPVAIKMLLRDALKSPEVLKRFKREQRTLSRLRSEHAIRVLGSGVHGSYPYMVMEYLDGSDLEEELKTKGPLPVEEAVGLVLQACLAIAEAHALGVTHRDLKPGNLFLTRRADGTPCIKVLDFGISKVMDPQQSADQDPDSAVVTKTTAVFGSPFYMSPEQMISARDVDARTDIWSLGVTLYELLTGNLPFAAASAEGVCRRILTGSPTPLREIRPSYPVGLDAAVLRCLQRSPSKRYATIADFAFSLVDYGSEHAALAAANVAKLVAPAEPQGPPSEQLEQTLPATPVPEAKTVYLEQDPRFTLSRVLSIAVMAMGTLALGAALGVWWQRSERSAASRSSLVPSSVSAAAAPDSTPAEPEPSSAAPMTAEPIPIEMDLDLEAPRPPRRRSAGYPGAAAGGQKAPKQPSATPPQAATAPQSSRRGDIPDTSGSGSASRATAAPATSSAAEAAPAGRDFEL